MDKYKGLDLKLDSLVIFSNLRYDEVISKLGRMFCSEDFVRKYADFVGELYRHNVNLSEYILKKVLEDENFYIVGKAQGKKFDPYIEECVQNELENLQEISRITSDEIKKVSGYDGYLPDWRNSDIDFRAEYENRIKNISKYGYGLYSRYFMFIIRDSEVIPVKHPDPQKLEDLIGYKRERDSVVNNTLALLDGKPAQNVLLYGDAGTGKSSTVKAIANEYSSQGLRLIEITKEQLRYIPHIIDSISKNPLKFILFIDDLSFSSGDDCFGALKATLEGSVSARADNIVIYATSNRRHLVKESFSDRDGDDIHRNDTIQELISLSARFGLKVNFSKPDKNSYFEIVNALAKKSSINLDENALSVQAEAFALKNGGRSARTAKQFVNQLINDRRY